MAASTQWHISDKSPGRLYQCPDELIPRYEEVQHIVDRIRGNLKHFLHLETAVRLVLDGNHVNPTASVISVPFEGDQDKVYENLGLIIFQQMWGYYLAADPKGTHHGLTNLVFDGNETSLVRRETEKFLRVLHTRNDLAYRVMSGYQMACDMPPFERDVYMRSASERHLDIHLGVRMFTYGEGVNRVSEIVCALREFSHGSSSDLSLAWADLNGVVRNCITLVHNEVKQHAEVELSLSPLPQVRCHAMQIGQVVMNLVLNAAQAIEGEGRIHIATHDSGDRIHIAIEDDGRGIAAEHLSRIFEPFFTTKPVGQGTGLGLAVCHEIIRQHGGQLWVDSRVGHGTRVVIELPCDPPDSAEVELED